MLNAEKYKERIKELDYRVAIDINSNELKHCNEMNCCNCKFRDNDCGRKRIEWLLEEYEEPILTEKGKVFLKQLIAPFKSNKFVSVCINKELQTLRIDYEIGWTSYSKKVLGEKWDLFKNLDHEFHYTSKELGL